MKKKARANKVRRASRSGPDTMGETGFAHNTILDLGTEWTVFGNPAWSIWMQYDQSLSMMAIDDTMNNVPMKCCDAVTAIHNGSGQTQLIGVQRGVYSPNLMDDEAVVNHHMMREVGWQVDCMAKQHGSLQSIWFPNGDDIPLDQQIQVVCQL
eukprot:2938603-Ditylum_brightwellii.AAC.2